MMLYIQLYCGYRTASSMSTECVGLLIGVNPSVRPCYLPMHSRTKLTAHSCITPLFTVPPPQHSHVQSCCLHSCHAAACNRAAAQAEEAPLEKQIGRWRQEVFKLLLSSRQAQLAHKQQAANQASAVARLQQQVKAAEDKVLLLDGRLLDRQVDLDLACMKTNRAEAQLQECYR